jgi:hypothetical protein
MLTTPTPGTMLSKQSATFVLVRHADAAILLAACSSLGAACRAVQQCIQSHSKCLHTAESLQQSYCTFSTKYLSCIAGTPEEKRFCVMSRSFGTGEEFCVTHLTHVKNVYVGYYTSIFFQASNPLLMDWSLCDTTPINHTPFRQSTQAVDASCPCTYVSSACSNLEAASSPWPPSMLLLFGMPPAAAAAAAAAAATRTSMAGTSKPTTSEPPLPGARVLLTAATHFCLPLLPCLHRLA